jgi:2,4-dienoyl-CoA reductase-like NADH-dependent reductase (Old Yellow Enzyme family)
MAHLFSPMKLRGLTLRNRIMMSPMCMYSAGDDGRATDWHLSHYEARAIGGVGLLLTEATAVEPRGRISQRDLGLWTDAQIEALARVVRLVQAEGAAIGVQLAHAGRKAWTLHKGHGPEEAVAPSALRFDDDWRAPHALSTDEIEAIIDAWQAAAGRADAAGFDLVEIHAAHGYLSHQFLSPLSNARTDSYGGALANRMRFLLRVTEDGRWPPSRRGRGRGP